MHENRIAGLERRLENLDRKVASGRYTEEQVAGDRAATERELALLIGIRDRNRALADEAPRMGAADEAAQERRRRIRERMQFTRGQRPTPSAPEPARTLPPPLTPRPRRSFKKGT